jgi:cytochrome c553
MYFQEEEKNCFLCHDASVAQKNIKGQFQKISAHPVEASNGLHDPKEPPALITARHVECADCHNPHAANGNTAVAPSVSGRLEKVSGVDINRGAVVPATNEYEICFKCHADWASSYPYIPRVINSTNTRTEFDTSNPSYHPVAGMGKNLDVPSIPSTYEPTLTVTSIIYCTDCHSDDGGVSRGPHGSRFPPILRDQYETAYGTPENPAVYALCYRCHDRQRILDDVSFMKNPATLKGGHSGHLAAGATCSTCHDPHGIKDDFQSGSHTHLINFSRRDVDPAPPPIFNDTGRYSGSCTLICHGVPHDNWAYGTASPAILSPRKAFPMKKR